ncbi:MAG: hypothetical protein ABWX63_09630 [Paeniglutamicibacter terrestris]|uniref:Integral membrane protein n=1 Tax=Paeniglutamicibacter terrestris TaxID=2723403 RepID=A0ABX1G9G7_9MICC|nr:hypothetical protein [Paeniglutamicibacter sp. Y32M11]ASN40030.1 hypothetical protein CGQ24_14100 [Arthrobacter sp. 7749]NKG22052.1 hypothetical protein [Paeniglutamicibacter terrestris]QXQ11266.1 hypothetical protein KUF55_04995 [Paeniglutamicibacter sp. Y32M11]
MIVDGFFIAGAILCALAVVLGVVATIIRDYPDDFALISVALLDVFLIVYGIGAAIRQAGGQPLNGEPWEFWGYLITALLVPALAFIWAVTDKSRYSNTVLAASGAVVFVMLYRMEQIWDGVLPA